MSCAECGTSPADYFTTRGDAVCRACYYREQIALQDERAEEALNEEIPEALREVGVRRSLKTKPVLPGTTFRRGLAVMLICASAAACWIVYVGFDKPAELLIAGAGLGFVITLRGYQIRMYQ